MQTNTSNIFIVNYSDLQDRYDAEFYSPYYAIEGVRSFVPLKKLTTSIIHPPEYPREFSEEGSQLIRSQNVRPLGISLEENPVFFSQNFLENRRTIRPEIGDVLVVRSGVNAGDTAVIEQNYPNVIIGADTLLCKCNVEIYPKFLQVYFFTDLGKRQMTRHITGATNKHLNSSNLGKVCIPLLNLGEQAKCINLYENAVKIKERKENEAKILLTTIDDYLLDELKIELPKKDDSLKSRIFTTQFSEITSVRFDPFFQKTKNDKIESIKFDNITLRAIAKIEKGQSITKEKIVSGKYPVIAGGQTSPYSHNEYNSEGNCITVSASGAYAGYVWYHVASIFASDCIVIRSVDEKEVLTTYIYELLRLKQSEIYLMQQGAGQPHVYPVDLARIKIPIVSIENQCKIVRHIKEIRLQAKALQQEANDILEQAKKQIEKEILGGAI